MPFPALLRTGLLLSSLGVAATYTLYETNPAFRAFVDRTLDQIANLWTDVLSALSPEERQQQRDRQRHVFLGELGSRGVQGARDAAAAVVPRTGTGGSASDSGVGIGSGIDVEGGGHDARMRRRALWEVAEENAAQIRARAAAREARASRWGSTRDGNAETSSKYPAGPTVFSADESAGSIEDATASTALHSHPPTSSRRDLLPPPVELDGPIPPKPHIAAWADFGSGWGAMAPPSSTDNAAAPQADADAEDVAFDDTASQSTTSTEKFSRIMTPTSPSLHSVSASEADMTESELRDVDPMEDSRNFRSDTVAASASDPPILCLDDQIRLELEDDDDDDPPMSDIGSLIDRSATPSTASLSDADEVMSVASGSAFSDAGWATAESGSGDEEWDSDGRIERVRLRL